MGNRRKAPTLKTDEGQGGVIIEEKTITTSRPDNQSTMSGAVVEMPTVTTLLQRKKLSAAKSAEPAQPIENKTTSIPRPKAFAAPTPIRASLGAKTPPPFRGQLQLEPLDIKQLKNQLKKARSVDIKKLALLGYFSRRFSELAFFFAKHPSTPPVLDGVVGYGNARLVSETVSQLIDPKTFPGLFEKFSKGEAFVGNTQSVKVEDRSGIASLGFTLTGFVGIFPMVRKTLFGKGTLTGLWVCGSRGALDIPEAELKALLKILSGLAL